MNFYKYEFNFYQNTEFHYYFKNYYHHYKNSNDIDKIIYLNFEFENIFI